MSCLKIRRPLLLVALLTGAYFIGAARGAKGDDQPGAALDGTWKLVSLELGGEERALEDDVRLVIAKDKVLYGGELLAALTNYPELTPKGLDLAFREPKQEYEGIYVIEKDRLKVCLNTRSEGPKERPSDFSTKEKPNLRVFNFQRLAPDEPPPPQRGFVGMVLALENEGRDVAIGGVVPNSPAEKAGLRAGDIVLKVGDDEVRDLETTVNAVRRKTPGSELKIQVRRGGKEQEIALKVAVFPFSFLGLLG